MGGQGGGMYGRDWDRNQGHGMGGTRDWQGSEGGGFQGRGLSRGPKGYKRSDERIREEICDRLMGETGIDASDIDIQVKNGEVTLSGNVKHRDDKRRVEDLVETVLGVKDVNNQLRRQATGTGGTQTGGTTGMGGTTGTGTTGTDTGANTGTKKREMAGT
ncbi:MAG: BON domain-containing protein [Myxococcota bacterium]